MQHCLRRSGDAVFRLGGEAFVVLFTASSDETALARAEQFRRAIADCRLARADNPGGWLTARFGVALCGDGTGTPTTADSLYAAADKVLYAAKARGRNCVCSAAVT